MRRLLCSENDRIILKTLLEENNQEIAPDLSINEYFEIFAAEQILKEYDLSYDDIKSGVVGAGRDGGIDSIHILINGSLVQDDTDISGFGRDVIVEVHIIQAKLETGFSEATIQKFDHTIGELFNLSNDLEQYAGVYNENLLQRIQRFREICTVYATRLPKLTINFRYVTIGDEVHPNVQSLECTPMIGQKGLGESGGVLHCSVE